jgi:hypothetical protein
MIVLGLTVILSAPWTLATAVAPSQPSLGSIVCSDFTRNSDGSWTSGAMARIGAYVVSHIRFEHDSSINGENIGQLLDERCGSSARSL